MTKFRKLACAALSVTMAATLAAGQVAAYARNSSYGETLSGENVQNVAFENLTGTIDLSNVTLSQLAGNVVDYGEQAEAKTISGLTNTKHTVIISLDVPSIVEVKGDDMTVAEYLQTNTGKQALKDITKSQDLLIKELSSAGIAFKEVARYSSVINAVAIEVNTVQYNKIVKLKGVTSAGLSQTYAPMEMPDAVENASNIYGTGIYDSTEIIEKYGFDGQGVTVAILDTGLDYTHEAFSYDPPKETLGITEDDISALLSATDSAGNPMLIAAQRTSGLTVNDLYLSDKVPFAFDYSDDDADVYPSYSQHGTHVAGIVAGKADTYTDKDGNVINTKGDGVMDFLGVAPEAQLVICKVFTDDLDSEDLGGATSEDIIAALDDCVTLGVDIINMSLGTTSGFSTMRDEDVDGMGFDLNRVYINIKNEGISLIAAAGNEFSSGFGSEFGTNLASNPDSGTVGSPSTYAGAMSVASVNGQKAPYLVGNPDEKATAVYYNESNDANSVPFDFAEEMLDTAHTGKTSGRFRYFVIPGNGSGGDYSATVKDALRPSSLGGKKQPGEKIIVVVRRGTLSFQQKVEIASEFYADGIIVYNNVPGTIRMSLGDILDKNRIPAISIDMSAGAALTVDPNNSMRLRSEGVIEIDKNNLAGPFMNDYSSWGATPDLKLKPDITSHGGEITSTVSGGYEEMSGTSMATPNFAGFMALVKNYLRDEHGLTGAELTTRTNQIVMSSATLLYDEDRLPYSPRKQGAGLASLSNTFTTKAYLSTRETDEFGTEDDRPKIELGEDESKKGVYTFNFYVTNFGDSALNFSIVSRFMTETLASDGLAVAEAAYMLDDIAPGIWVDGTVNNNGKITVAPKQTSNIRVTLELSAAEKKYLDKSFVNGMYVEGFISLVSLTDGQCDLNLPFMGFYGDWEQAPMLDYTIYELSAIQQDTSLTDDQKPHASVFATQLVSTYFNGRYALPMGGYAYLQDEREEQIYVLEEHCSVSRFNIYNGPTDTGNYLTSTGIRALYAGLLRNAELVTYDIYNADTGEIIYQGRDYSVGKAYSGGGTSHPGLVDMKLNTDDLGLLNNGKYEIEFNFYMYADDESTKKGENTFSSIFYADFDAPILQESRIRYEDYKDGNKIKQRIFLDLDVYDNHYPQAVLLCYSDGPYDPENPEINLATDYVTPVYKPGRNTTNTVTIEITDIYYDYKDYFYVQLDDYALNHSVWQIYINDEDNPSGGLGANSFNQGNDFNFVLNDRVTRTAGAVSGQYEYHLTLDVNEMYRVELDCGTGNASNYKWSTNREDRIKIKNNEIFGLRAGTARVDVKGSMLDGLGNRVDKTITLIVDVVDSDRKLSMPTLSFGLIKGTSENLQPAVDTVQVNAGQKFTLEVKADPWYYPVENLSFRWSSSNESIATVDQNGNVETLNTRGTATISAAVIDANGNVTNNRASVLLSVQEPFNISNMTLNKYYGSDEVVVIPNDKNVMYIGEEAFKDNDTMRVVVIPKTVVEISARAFRDCTALEEVYFIDITDDSSQPVADLSALNLILSQAFMGCTNLKLLDLTNVKVITIASLAFAGTPLEKIRHMEKIGIADDYAFWGTNLESIDISGLHTSGIGVFDSCTSLKTVKTAHYTAMGEGMFYGCTSLKNVVINNPEVPGSAFEKCSMLESVTFGGELEDRWQNTVFSVGSYAFYKCKNLKTVDFNGYSVSAIGDYAFADTAIKEFTIPAGNPVLGLGILDGTNATINWNGYESNTDGAIYSGTTLIKAPALITSSFAIKSGTTAIGPYAFSDSEFDSGVTTVSIPATVTKMEEGAFARTPITSIEIPASITGLPAFAFMQSKLQSVAIHAGITEIGEGAFADCLSLTQVTFASGSSLKSIGDGVFSGTAITQITLPDGVATMGSLVFINCENLVKVNLPSVKSLGGYTFENCPALEEVTFGANATDSGIYTFFPGFLGYDYDEYGNIVPVYAESALHTVDLGGLTEIKEGVFTACKSLEQIDLKNVTVVGERAFASCNNLATAKNLDKVTYIGYVAFAETAFKTINLASAVYVGQQAFINVEATSLTLSSIETIEAQAFAGIAIDGLNLPASLKKVGDGAFMAAARLGYISVATDNKVFFAEGNVLYRNIVNARTGDVSYELCLYPAGRTATTYTVKEGTSQIQGYAFAWLGNNVLTTVTMPYSLKTVGSAAFYGSAGISRYNFESIEAPRLLSEYYDTGLETMGFYSLYYRNFYQDILGFTPELIADAIESPLEIGYPSNGTGYDNYIFSHFFGRTANLGELMDDHTRALIALLDSFNVATVESWNSLAVNDENKAMVAEFAEKVKTAHLMFNNIVSAKQLEYLNNGADRSQKLTDIEAALKPVKTRFAVPVNISTVTVAASSNHKSQYNAGETFDLTGLVIEVVYDDYTSELITDTSNVKLRSAGPLYSYEQFVDAEFNGFLFRIPVNVTSGQAQPPVHTEHVDENNDGLCDVCGEAMGNGGGNGGGSDSNCSGCGSIDIGSTMGGMGLLLLTLTGALLLVQRIRRRAGRN